MVLKLSHTSGSKKIILSDLVSVKTLQRIQDNLANALGISLVIVGIEGKDLITKKSNVSTFCEKMTKIESFDQACKKDYVESGMKCFSSQRSNIMKCHAGLYSFTVPIMVNGRMAAFFRGGQVRLSNPDIAECKNSADRYDVDFDAYLEAFLGIPLFSEDKLHATVELISVVANTISHLALSGEIAKSKATELVHLNDLLEKEVMRKTDELRLSEEKYRSIFDNALDVIYTLDASGVITNINSVVEKLLGYEKEYVIGKRFDEFVWDEDLQLVKSSFGDLKHKKRMSTRGLRFRLKSKDGKPIYFELNSRASYDEDGDMFNIDGILRDIDQALKVENKLRSVKEKYKELFDAMRDGVYMTDEYGRIKVFNKGALRILGYSKLDDVYDKLLSDMYENNSDREVFLKDLSKKGFIEDYVVKLKKKDGTSIYVEATSNELRDADGNLKGVEGVFRDVTEKVELRKRFDLMKKYMENLIQHAGYAIIGVDMNRKVFVWNKGAEEIFEYSATEAVGRDVSAIIPRDWREHRADLVKRVERGEVVRDIRATRETKSGKRIDISLTLSPIKNNEDKVVGVSAIAEKIDK